jgi:NitT/TauT family transport system permease protein
MGAEVPTSAVLDVLRRSHFVLWLGGGVAALGEQLDRLWRRCVGEATGTVEERRRGGRAMTVVLWAAIAVLAVRGIAFVATTVTWHEAVIVVGLGMLTLLRVAAVVGLAALVWTPVGVWIGMNRRIARIAQPAVQVLASFPANFLFPLFALLFVRFGLSLEWGGAVLMALGAQWYILFNTIAGATAIPNELREMTRDLGVRRGALWRALILPAIFPAWVTGALTAAGGAWNASIVAEVVTWGDTTLAATGLGAYITAATTAGDWPRIVLGVSVMSTYVVTVNRLLWRRLERLAVARYSLAA